MTIAGHIIPDDGVVGLPTPATSSWWRRRDVCVGTTIGQQLAVVIPRPDCMDDGAFRRIVECGVARRPGVRDLQPGHQGPFGTSHSGSGASGFTSRPQPLSPAFSGSPAGTTSKDASASRSALSRRSGVQAWSRIPTAFLQRGGLASLPMGQVAVAPGHGSLPCFNAGTVAAFWPKRKVMTWKTGHHRLWCCGSEWSGARNPGAKTATGPVSASVNAMCPQRP